VCFPGRNAKVAAAAPKQKRWSKSRPYFGTVLAFEGLCNIASADDKDTIRVEVDLGDSALTYTPGDALGILPYNCPQVGLLRELSCYLLSIGAMQLTATPNSLMRTFILFHVASCALTSSLVSYSHESFLQKAE
jgi:sulfite reductase alpha subunit-like flavoprotein